MPAGSGVNNRDQFKNISIRYKEVHGRVHSAIYRVLQELYYPRLAHKRILDVGNGGQPPLELLGAQISDNITSFVGLDNSIDMLKRMQSNYARVLGDGLYLPFKDKSFDYVICNGVIHHLGFSSRGEQALRFKQFVNECLRVCRYQVIVYELVTPKFLEQLERFVAKIMGHMPTFVLSEFTLDRCLKQINVKRSEIISKTLSDLTSPFYWYVVIMEYEFFKLPAFLSLFRHIFFVLSVDENNKFGF